jgi:hypothetical protein
MFFNILCGLKIIGFQNIIEVSKLGNIIENNNLKINNMEIVNFKETAGGFECKIINTDNKKHLKTETKFTKGKWHTYISPEKKEAYISANKTYFIAQVFCRETDMYFEETIANANLISAAPDLLEALTMLYDSLPDGYTSDCLPFVRKAIKKATSISF